MESFSLTKLLCSGWHAHTHTEAPFVAVTKRNLQVRSIKSRCKQHNNIYLLLQHYATSNNQVVTYNRNQGWMYVPSIGNTKVTGFGSG